MRKIIASRNSEIALLTPDSEVNKPVIIKVNAHIYGLDTVDPHLTLLEFLRESLHLRGTKQGCGTGDCGACTVIVATGEAPNESRHAINSCITPALAVAGKQVITVEGIASDQGLHPVQQAMVDANASQCGFCTPGFVMSLVDFTASNKVSETSSRSDVIATIGGNLCRCTGYRPIVEAGLIACSTSSDTDLAHLGISQEESRLLAKSESIEGYIKVDSESAFLDELNTSEPGSRLILSGGTDAWIEVTSRLLKYDKIIDISDVATLKRIDVQDGILSVGACTTLSRLLSFFSAGACRSEAMVNLLKRFGSKQIRNRATIGGNLCSASPIGDLIPALLVLEATAVLTRANGSRILDLEEFIEGYRKTALAKDEYLSKISLSIPESWSSFAFRKLSKRYEDDISSVSIAVFLLHDNVRINEIRIALGGAGDRALRLFEVEKIILGRRLIDIDWRAVSDALDRTIFPISDVRASADYRQSMAIASIKEMVDQFFLSSSGS